MLLGESTPLIFRLNYIFDVIFLFICWMGQYVSLSIALVSLTEAIDSTPDAKHRAAQVILSLPNAVVMLEPTTCFV